MNAIMKKIYISLFSVILLLICINSMADFFIVPQEQNQIDPYTQARIASAQANLLRQQAEQIQLQNQLLQEQIKKQQEENQYSPPDTKKRQQEENQYSPPETKK